MIDNHLSLIMMHDGESYLNTSEQNIDMLSNIRRACQRVLRPAIEKLPVSRSFERDFDLDEDCSHTRHLKLAANTYIFPIF